MRNGWTIETALKHLTDLRDADLTLYTSNRMSDQLRNEQRFIAQEKAVEAALSSAKTATEKAEFAAERRFDSVNEFRGQLRDAQSLYITRSEVAAIVGTQSTFVTRTEMFSWVGVAAVVGGIIGHFIK
jgi:ElaB/YqjD/DUF883 family membrane-anchored ribosome-binding protein